MAKRIDKVDDDSDYPIVHIFKGQRYIVLKDYYIERTKPTIRVCYRIGCWNHKPPKFETRFERYDKHGRRWKPVKNQGLVESQLRIVGKILPVVIKDLRKYTKLHTTGELQWLLRKDLEEKIKGE